MRNLHLHDEESENIEDAEERIVVLFYNHSLFSEPEVIINIIPTEAEYIHYIFATFTVVVFTSFSQHVKKKENGSSNDVAWKYWRGPVFFICSSNDSIALIDCIPKLRRSSDEVGCRDNICFGWVGESDIETSSTSLISCDVLKKRGEYSYSSSHDDAVLIVTCPYIEDEEWGEDKVGEPMIVVDNDYKTVELEEGLEEFKSYLHVNIAKDRSDRVRYHNTSWKRFLNEDVYPNYENYVLYKIESQQQSDCYYVIAELGDTPTFYYFSATLDVVTF